MLSVTSHAIIPRKGENEGPFSFCLLVPFFPSSQVSYLTWGVLQERVMTGSYGATDTSPGEHFTDSQFLVLMNRVLALIVAGLYCVLRKQPRHGAPMYRYSFASLSNVLSSWCQYEALKFVSFPTQVLAKASKVIPVMMMGKLVSRRSYEHWEYLTAGLISIGVSMFLLSSGPEPEVLQPPHSQAWSYWQATSLLTASPQTGRMPCLPIRCLQCR